MALEARSTDEGDRATPSSRERMRRCLWLILDVEPTQIGHNLVLSVNFGRGRFEIFGGSIDFGLSEADLSVFVQGGAIPVESRWPKQLLKQDAIVKRTQTNEHAETRKAAHSANGGVGEKGPLAQLSTSHEDSAENRQGIKDEFDFSVQSVTNSGSPVCPVWRFESLPGTHYLSGRLTNQVIGEVKIDSNASSAKINARCEILARFINLVDSDGFLAGMACNSKLAVIRAIVRNGISDELKASLGCIDLEVAGHG